MTMHRITAVAALVAIASLALAAPAGAEEVSFSDGADDAYRFPGTTGRPPSAQPPSALLSDPSADILNVGFATVTTSKGNPNQKSYSVSMTITGPADASYSYVVAGEFGEDCDIFHFLTPGITSFANAFCDDTSRFIGRISGSAVVLNGTTLSATYTYMPKKLPAELAADTQLGPLFAYTCVSGEKGLGCASHEVLDFADSPLGTFTI